MTTTTPAPLLPVGKNGGQAARLLFGGAGLLLFIAGCSDDSSPAVGSTVSNSVSNGSGGTQPASTATTTVAPAATSLAPGATLAPIDGAALLQQAVAATGAGYHFNQTATIDGLTALTIDGDRLTDGARVAVSSDAGVVFWIITPDGTWLMPENGEWEVDDSDPPAVDPISALTAPTSVTVVGNDGTTIQLVVSVSLSSIGIPGDGEAPLQVSVVSGALSTITYSTTTADGKTAAATTIIGPVVDPSPVEPPL